MRLACFPALLVLLLASGPVTAQDGGPPGDAPVIAPAFPAESVPAPAPARVLRLPAQTVLSLELLQPISTRTAKTGDRFELRVLHPVLVEGQVAIPAGSPALGEVIHSQKGGAFGKAGELLLTVRHVDVQGQKIPMRLFRPAQGSDRTGVVLATTIAVGIFSAFIRGEQIELPAGMAVSASVARETSIPAPALPASAVPVVAPPSPTETQGQDPK